MRNRNKISDCWCFKLHWSPLATTSWSSAASIPFSPPYKSTCWIEDNAWLLCLFTLTTSWVNLFKTALLSPLTTQPTWSVAVSLMWCKSDSRPYAQVLLHCVSKNYKFIAIQPFPGRTLPGGNSLNSNCFKKREESQESCIVGALFLMAVAHLQTGDVWGKQSSHRVKIFITVISTGASLFEAFSFLPGVLYQSGKKHR